MVGIEKVDIEKVVGRHLVLSENINVEQYYTKKRSPGGLASRIHDEEKH